MSVFRLFCNWFVLGFILLSGFYLILLPITSERLELVALNPPDVVALQVELAQLPQTVEGVVEDRLDVGVVEKQNFQVLPSDE